MYIHLFILTAAIWFQEKVIKFKDNSFCLSLKGNLETTDLALNEDSLIYEGSSKSPINTKAKNLNIRANLYQI